MITKDTLIIDVLKNYPKTSVVFDKYNMGCLSCGGVRTETLKRGCVMHGVDVDKFIIELINIIDLEKTSFQGK